MIFDLASAEILAIKAIDWIATDNELFEIFLGSSGADLNDVKAGAKDNIFLGSVLDFILMDDDWVKAFCESKSFEFNEPYLARQFLPGGDLPNWT
ncbi:DUF3572 domain-containing protein [Amylibacter sp.]|jgi:hypothetical protein|nr:DUF3572 domain-containing protein [Amylibacter sp.]MDB2563919.1 DUF3572 domain-containing protein [Amylibacter sp.]MDB3902962.1 DUF3572 domain-containing protein [Amylibacter sp.]MDB4838757.1 DUF3572 domain-containing protein [Amylibacter sp.]MDG2158195.1 DUF3572 domain-containing protein [Amylibacter sp.]